MIPSKGSDLQAAVAVAMYAMRSGPDHLLGAIDHLLETSITFPETSMTLLETSIAYPETSMTFLETLISLPETSMTFWRHRCPFGDINDLWR